MPVLPLVCLCLGLLWLPRRVAAGVVAAALAPGLAVLFALAPTRLGQLADPAGLWAWLPVTGLPSLAAGAGTGPARAAAVSQARIPPSGDGRARVSR